MEGKKRNKKSVFCVLIFVCEETLGEEINLGYSGPSVSVSVSGGDMVMRSGGGGRNVERNEYVYDYQLIKKSENIEETRILLKENGKKKNEKNAPLKTKRFYSRRFVLGPTGWISKSQHVTRDFK